MFFQCSCRASRSLVYVLLLTAIVCLFSTVAVFSQSAGYLIQVGDSWRYFKGYSEASEPVTAWRQVGFDDGSWLTGPTGIGYGDGDDVTVLDDMHSNYVSVFMRRTFTVPDPAGVQALTLEVDYDDGFVAYLNGIEVARRQMGNPGDPVAYDTQTVSCHGAGRPEVIDISVFINLLLPGENVLAIQGHNCSIQSSDFSMIPALRWEYVPLTPTDTPMPTNTPVPTATSTPLPTNTPTPTNIPIELSIDEPLFAGDRVVKGNGIPGALVVILDLDDLRIVAVGEVDSEGRYEIDLTSVLEIYQLGGLQADHRIRAESEGQVYQAIVQPINTPTVTTTPLPTDTPTSASTNTPPPTNTPVELSIDEPLFAGDTVVRGNGTPGALVVLLDLDNIWIVGAGRVNGEGRYEVNFISVLETCQLNGLQADHRIRAESEGQVYQAVVHHRIFLPLISKFAF